MTTQQAWRNLAFRRRLLADEGPARSISLAPGHVLSTPQAGVLCPDAEGYARTCRGALAAAIYAARLALRQDGDHGAAVADADTHAAIAAYVGEADTAYVRPGSRLAGVGARILEMIPTGGISRSRALAMLADIGQAIGCEDWARLTPLDVGFDPTLHGPVLV